MTVFFVRHGESEWNADGLIQGQRPVPGLTTRGQSQATAAAEVLASDEVRELWSSDALRAQETAGIIGARLGLVPTVTPLLRERHWGSLQGACTSVAVPLEARLSDGDPLPGGGESRRDVRARLHAFVELIGGPAVVVTHGDVVLEAQRLWGTAGSSPVANGAVIPIEVARLRPGPASTFVAVPRGHWVANSGTSGRTW